MADEVEHWPTWWANLYAFVARDPASNRAVVDHAGPTADDVVVDIGCGAGAAVRRAASLGATATGIDPSSGMVAAARRRAAANDRPVFAEGHAADLPLADDSITIAWAIATFHHWPDRRAGLVEVRRVLAPGGRLLLGEKLLRRFGEHGLSSDQVDDTADLLADVGFADIEVTTVRPRWSRMAIIGARA